MNEFNGQKHIKSISHSRKETPKKTNWRQSEIAQLSMRCYDKCPQNS